MSPALTEIEWGGWSLSSQHGLGPVARILEWQHPHLCVTVGSVRGKCGGFP